MFYRIWFITLFLFTTLFANAEVDSGKAWLIQNINQQAVDINSSDLALAAQTSKETLSAAQMLNSVSDLDENFVLFPLEDSLDENTTEYLSAKISSYVTYGKDTTSLVARLLALQNKDGGFGHSSGHQSTALDTALALEVFSQVSIDQQVVSNAVNYLLGKQLPNGAWIELLDDGTNYTAAVAMRALWLHRKSYDLQSYLENAKNYLLSQKDADGSYGEIFESALVLRAIAPLHYDKTALQNSIDHLKTQQQPTGSWDEDIYTTALVLQALFMADKEVPNPDLATLSGTIVDGDTGIALSGITVELEGVMIAATGSDGRFAFSGLQNGTYTLNILSPNHAPLHTSVRMIGEDIDLGTLRLNKNADSTISTLKGVIKDAATGTVLDGVTVSIGDKETTTDSSGSYIIDSIEAGTYSITISKVGYMQKRQTVSIPSNTILYYNATLQIIDFTVEATIQGSVVAKDTTVPLEGVLVEISGSETQSIITQSDGRFVFSKIGAGSYDIKISKEGYRTQIASMQIDQSKVVDFGVVALEIADPNETTVTLKGVVSEAQTKLPIEGASVRAGTFTAYTDGNGYYEIIELNAGAISIEVSKEGYRTVTVQANATAGTALSFSPTLQKVDEELAIYGTVFAANDLIPLQYVKVDYIGETNGTVYTDAKGYYLISPVNPGPVTLKYSLVGYETIIFDTNLTTDSLNLSPKLTVITSDSPINNASLEGVILDLITKKPIEGVNISVVGLQTNTLITSDSQGRFDLDNIASYDLNLTFSKSGYKNTLTIVHFDKDEQFNIGPVSMRPITDKDFYPDLTATDIDLTQINIAQDDLNVSGSLNVTVINAGGVPTGSGFALLAFYDVNRDGNFSDQVDFVLGETSSDTILDVDQNTTVSLTLSGKLPYVNAPISIWVDSKTNIMENNETNNIIAVSKKCGVVSEIFTSSYQAQAVKKAIVNGSDYIAPQTMSWDRRNRCLGCHIQTQTLVGLQASMAKAEVDTVTGEYLLAKILSSQQSNGSILNSYSYWPKTQTGYALWSLSYVPDANRTFNVRANALRMFNQTKSTSNGRIYWTPEYTSGWLDSTEILTSIVAFGASRYLKDAKTQETLAPLEEDMVSQYTALLPQITRYLLDRASSLYSSNNSNNMRIAILMLGLGEARRHVTDQSLYQEVDQMIKNLEQRLRSRQNNDGGWGYISGKSSDPLTSAWVGFALDYQSPSPTDQGVLQNIQFLLDTQKTDGTWVTNSGKYSTRLATTSLVMAYLPIALDFLDSADLSISMMRLNENTDGTLDLSARIGNGGSDQLRTPTSVSFYAGDPTKNGILISEEDILSLGKWEYYDITLKDISIAKNDRVYAIVDPSNWVFECNELNNYMDIPASASKLYGEITVLTDKPFYGSDEAVLLTSVSTNLGKLDASLSARLILEDPNGNIIQAFSTVDLGIVASGENRTISETWNTGTTLAGEYVLRGVLYDTEGNLVDEATTNFSIAGEDQDGVQATLDVGTDRLRYHTTDHVMITNFIESLSSNSIISDAKVVLQITDSNSNVVNTQTLSLSELLPSSTKEANTHYAYTRLPVGEYTVQATLYGNGNNVYASDSATFEVYEDLTQALKGSVSVAWNSELAGADQTCEYSVTNFGSTSLIDVPLELRVMDMNRSMVTKTFARTADINTTQTMQDSEPFPTNHFEAGDYSCALFAKTGESWTLLDHQPFTVEVPPIILEGSIEQKGKGRLLVLLDPCDANASCEEPFGSKDALALPGQRAYLESLLTTNGYSYTIVTDDVNFTRELRSGAYSTYLLLDETVKLPKSTQNELREALFKGEGLLVSGTHDSRNHFVYESLGVKYTGHHSKVESVEVIGEGYGYFEDLLLDKTHAVSFDAEGTVRLANYLPEGTKATLPAVVKYRFGQGESLFAGFDLLAEASTHPESSYGNFLLEALADIYQDTANFNAGNIIPMTLEVINDGIATPIRADLNLTSNARFVDAIDADFIAMQSLSFSEEILAEEETKTYRFWIQALQAQSEIELIAHIFSLLDGDEVEQAQFTYSVSVGTIADIESILAQADQIVLTDKQDSQRLKQTLKELEQAQNYMNAANLDEALKALLKATDNLQVIEDKGSVRLLRVMIGQQIREIEIKINRGEE